jgi:hypothetical protein
LAAAMKKNFRALRIPAALHGINTLYLILVTKRSMKGAITLIHPSSACLQFRFTGKKKLFFSNSILWLFQKNGKEIL